MGSQHNPPGFAGDFDAWDPDDSSARLEPFLPRLGAAMFVAALMAVMTTAGLYVYRHVVMRPATVQVPELVGLPLEAASTEAAKMGLRLEVAANLPDGVVADGAVSRQVPLAGEQTEQNAVIQVTRSTGPEQTVVPRVEGLLLDEAMITLSRAGFVLSKVILEESGQVVARTGQLRLKARVKRLLPESGKPARKGSAVTLIVSK